MCFHSQCRAVLRKYFWPFDVHGHPGLADSHSRGLFAGLSLEGGVIVSRPDVNRKFYGRQVSVRSVRLVCRFWRLFRKLLRLAHIGKHTLVGRERGLFPCSRLTRVILWGKNEIALFVFVFVFLPGFPQHCLLTVAPYRHRRIVPPMLRIA